ncbi:N-acetylmuramoyl-L-alanine amidase [Aquimarina sp. TRL1]|uniref:N-acetylmuramoyl-L-alanine amidase n=1 Tax=Aquimarina sp. (strain TRL1) TaxID=2736252 RepID=UPI00158E68FD|nr:N-acetylmuramoyl-L-alanine amidase [Aquimarina sp. TRL1]QKX04882.1 N-acetylmuramoyl-L-alanine amidase [Aquimarina sp. TRL1]
MREITTIVVHCLATIEGEYYDINDVDKMHKKRGFRCVGYHKLILLDGSVQNGRPLHQIGAHVKGKNEDTIGVAYVGGLDQNGSPKDTRTSAQKKSLKTELKKLKNQFRNAKIKGHRDLSPDRNGNGKIERFEWLKACPCFDAIKEYKNL